MASFVANSHQGFPRNFILAKSLHSRSLQRSRERELKVP